MKRWDSGSAYRLHGKRMLSGGNRFNRRVTRDFLHLRRFQKDIQKDDESKPDGGTTTAINAVTMDTAQLVSEKLNMDPSAAYYGCDLVYLARTYRNEKAHAARNRAQSVVALPGPNGRTDAAAASRTDTAVSSSGKVERYIALIRKKDTPKSISLLKISKKSSEVEVKHSFDLSLLRAIDFGSEDIELLLSFESADHNFFFHSQNERDESLWVIIQLTKYVVGNDINVGYSIDLDSLTYIATTNGTLSRFPMVQKLITAFGHQNELQQQGSYSIFTKEEDEAEVLLNELNWGMNLDGHSDLLQTLSERSSTINHEIIDFLLQWEEMDEQKNRRGSSTAADSAAAGGAATANKSIGRLSIAEVKDTGEVLRALNEVDHELETADRWLGEQIDRLSSIQDNLHVIEAESTALETSWQSLNSLQKITQFIVEKYSLPEQLEQLLQQPSSILKAMMASAPLSHVETLLTPLVQAATMLRDALTLSHEDMPDITFAKFRQLQNMQSIASQRAKLTDIAESFISAFTPTGLDMFEWVLRHKTLNETGTHPKDVATGSKANATKIGAGTSPAAISSVLQIKAFDLSLVTQYCLYDQLHPSSNNKNGLHPKTEKNQEQAIPTWFVKMKSKQYNQLFMIQTTFQRCALPLLPLLNLLVDLAPSSAQELRNSYIAATTHYMYSPLLKVLARDVQNLLHAQKNQNSMIVNLAFCGKWKNKGQLPLRFQGIKTKPPAASTTNGNTISVKELPSSTGIASNRLMLPPSPHQGSIGVSPWLAVRIVLMLICPVIEQEELFVQKALQYKWNGRSIPGLTDKTNRPPPLDDSLLFDILDAILERPLNKLKAALNLLNPKMVAKDGSIRERGGGILDNSLHGETSAVRGRESSISSVDSLPETTTASISVSDNGNKVSLGTKTAPITANKGDRDGIEAIAMLSVVSEFQTTYLRAATASITSVADNSKTSSAMKRNELKESSDGSVTVLGRGQSAPVTGSVVSFLEKRGKSGSVRFNDTDAANEKAGGDSLTDGAQHTIYLNYVLNSIRMELTRRVNAFTADQVAWIHNQKADGRIPGVLLPFVSYPIFIMQVMEMTNDKHYECVDNLIVSITSELLNWLNEQAEQSEKYSHKIRIVNLSYFILQVQQLQDRVPLLSQFLSYAQQQVEESEVKYVNWMVAYEFPALSALATRMDGVGSRVNEEELSLYIRRRDVINVVKELDQRHVESCVSILWKRLLKHFKSEYDAELNLVDKSWLAIRKRVTSILKRLQEAAEQSYQIKLTVGPQFVGQIFDRFIGQQREEIQSSSTD